MNVYRLSFCPLVLKLQQPLTVLQKGNGLMCERRSNKVPEEKLPHKTKA